MCKKTELELNKYFVDYLVKTLSIKLDRYIELAEKANYESNPSKTERRLNKRKHFFNFLPKVTVNIEPEVAKVKVVSLSVESNLAMPFVEFTKERLQTYRLRRTNKVIAVLDYLGINGTMDVSKYVNEELRPLAENLAEKLSSDINKLFSKHQVEKLADALINKLLRSAGFYTKQLKGDTLKEKLYSALVYNDDRIKTDSYSHKNPLHKHLFFKKCHFHTIHHILKKLDKYTSFDENSSCEVSNHKYERLR